MQCLEGALAGQTAPAAPLVLPPAEADGNGRQYLADAISSARKGEKPIDVDHCPVMTTIMNYVLRQLVMLLVVALVTMGVTVSAGSAAIDLKCDMMLKLASIGASGGHSDVGVPSDTRWKTAFVEDHVHEDTLSDDHGAHCEAHACPATALLGHIDVTRALLISQTLDAVPTSPLVELMVGEGPRRPPRA